MFRTVIRFFLCLFILAPVFAASQSTSAQPETIIRVNTNLVLVDVTVSDAQQNPVHRLDVPNFTVMEDGHAQIIKVFEEHAESTSAPLPPLPRLGPGTFTNYSPVPASGALDVLLLDMLNTPADAQAEVREQVLKYLREAPVRAPIAIFTLTTELKLLQGFTGDPAVLRAMVEGKKGSPSGSPLMNNPMAGDQTGADDAWTESTEGVLGNSPDWATTLAALQQFKGEQQSFQFQMRARYTLDALNLLARYLSNLPGRKNLIWFSGSFPLSILPDPSLQNPFAIVGASEDEFRETVDLLARGQVAVYPIDARGLMVEPMVSAASSGRVYAANPKAYAASVNTFFQQTSAEHATMNQMAEATGGKAFVNTNGLAAAVEKAVNAGSNYYTIAYAPTNHDWDGKYRKIEVRVNLPKVTLSFRRGYFADDPNATMGHNSGQNEKNALPHYDALRSAMMWGAPDPTEIIFAANVHPSSAGTEPAVATGNEIAKKTSGPYRRYTVDFHVSPRTIDCAAAPDGEHHCALDFMTFVYDTEGTLVNSQTDGIRVSLSPAQFASLLKGHFSYRQQVSVPAQGKFYLRLGLRDATSNRVGALELPVTALAKLKPVAAGTAEPAATVQLEMIPPHTFSAWLHNQALT